MNDYTSNMESCVVNRTLTASLKRALNDLVLYSLATDAGRLFLEKYLEEAAYIAY